MAHQLLLYANRSAGLVQEPTVGVPECVPAQSRDADLLALGLENLLLDNVGVVTTPGDVRRESVS